MKIIATLFLITVIATGCAVQPQKKIALSSTFDREHAERLLKQGENTIRGSALMRQIGGGIVTCAGNEVALMPATAYAVERMKWIYGSEVGGAISASASDRLDDPFVSTDSNYIAMIRTARCDAQGFFKFDKISDGSFFIISTIRWKSDPRSIYDEGGTMMQKVSVYGGESKEIVLSPPS